MGGLGSGTTPYRGNGNNGGGRRKVTAIAVAGTGSPIKPDDLPEAVARCWDRLAEIVQGVAYSQDSEAMTETAWLMWRQQEFRAALANNPLDDELNRLSMAVGRSLSAMLTQFGLSPRSRQVLLVPKSEQEEPDELEKLMNKRKFFNSGVPNRKRDLEQ